MMFRGLSLCVMLFFNFASAQDTAQHADSCVKKGGKAACEDQHDKVQMLQSGVSVLQKLALDDRDDKLERSDGPNQNPNKKNTNRNGKGRKPTTTTTAATTTTATTTTTAATPAPAPEPAPTPAKPEPEPEPESEEAKHAQFLISATFGPTKKTLAEKKSMTYPSWISKQMTLPLTSHREYYRTRTNPDVPSTSFSTRDVCAKGSRWSDSVFGTVDAMTQALVTISKGELLVNGKRRASINPATPVPQCTDIPPPPGLHKRVPQLGGKTCKAHGLGTKPWKFCYYPDWIQNGWCQQTCFDKMQAIEWHVDGEGAAGYDCSGGWANKKSFKSYMCPIFFNSSLGAMIRFSSDKLCSQLIRMPQLAAWANSGAPALNADLFEKAKNVDGALFLKADETHNCASLKTGVIKVGSQFLLADHRSVLAENTPANPVSGRTDMCVPRTPVNKGTCTIGNTNSACPLACGSPGEVANVPTEGHLYPMQAAPYIVNRRRRRHVQEGAYNLDTRRNVPLNLAKSMVWTEIVMNSGDQLRQRVAWALSQIIVVGTSGFPQAEMDTELWTNFYDIMVRNAFGNFKNILREVTYSPVMATYLTYLNSKSFDSSGTAPDENYAREIMQLFTIGLDKLDTKGVTIKDAKNLTVPTYTPRNIMEFARVFTGFTEQPIRANIEPSEGNRIDPIVLDSTFHDKYPKPNLEKGGYLGDRYPLCADLPKNAFLQKGATYEFLGSKSFYAPPRGTYWGTGQCKEGYYDGNERNDAADISTCLAKCKSEAKCRFVAFLRSSSCRRYDSRAGDCKSRVGNKDYAAYKIERGPEGVVYEAQASSALAAALSSASPQVTLSQDIPCTATECKLDTMDMIAAGDNLYAFVKPHCVYSFFAPVQKEIDCRTTQVLDPASQPFCCTPGSAQTVPGIKEEQFYFKTQGSIGDLTGLTPSKVRIVPLVDYKYGNGVWPGWTTNKQFTARWTGSLAITTAGSYTFSLSSDDGSRLIMDGSTTVVDNDGVHKWKTKSGTKHLASGLHPLKVEYFQRGSSAGIAFKYSGPDTNNQERNVDKLQVAEAATCVRPATAAVTVLSDGKVTGNVPENSFPVSWDGATPVVITPMTVAAKVEEVKVFSQVPAAADLQQLMTGAFAPSVSCSHCNGPVKAYAAAGATIDEKTVFEYKGAFFKNSKSLVHVSDGPTTFSFRNPPVFLHPRTSLGKHEQNEAADAEVLSVIDHLLYHQNTPFNIGRKMIQRLTMSNPPLKYLQEVAAAFRTGEFNGQKYSGQYGDLGAMVAAIFLHPDARTSGRTSGGLREPMVKIIHFMRSMEYVDSSADPIVFQVLVETVGQFPYYSPTVFNYYDADYMPMNLGMPGNMGPNHTPEPEPEPEPLVAPEFEILTPPYMLNLLNGMRSLTIRGVSSCENDQGFGLSDSNIEDNVRRRRAPGCLQGTLNADTTIADLDILLTGGRLTGHHKGTLRATWESAIRSNQSPEKAAKQAMLLMPEFHNLGDPVSRGIRGPEPTPTQTKQATYKALVMLFMSGGADTFNMLVPRDCPLHNSYATARAGCNIPKNDLLAISADTQDCKKFGIHPSMPQLQKLYVAKDAAFISNIGALIAPSTRFDQRGRCPNQGSHTHGQVAAQTLTCQGVGLFTGGGGMAGKFADELAATRLYKTSSFSIYGKPAWSETPKTKVQVFEGTNGVITFEGYYGKWKDTIANITKEKLGNVFLEEYTIAFKDAVNSSEYFSQFLKDPQYNPQSYGPPNSLSKLSKQLRQVAKLIATRTVRKADRDFFWTQTGGWDTHNGINGRLPLLLGEVDEAVHTFVTEMKRQSVFNDVTLITASDFGRTISYNGKGTDHAWGGNYFIVGGSVKGGVVYNEFLKDYISGSHNDQVDGSRGRVVPKFPWENVMVPVAKWLGVAETSLNKIFPNLANFNRSSHILSESVLFESKGGAP